MAKKAYEELRGMLAAVVAILVLFIGIPLLGVVDAVYQTFTDFREQGFYYLVPKWATIFSALWYLLVIAPFAYYFIAALKGWPVYPAVLVVITLAALATIYPIVALEVWVEEKTGREKVI